MKNYRPGTPLNAAFASRVGSAYHAELLEKSLPPDIAWYGALARDAEAAMPERHLGLLPAAEIDGLSQRIDRMADRLATTAAAQLPPPIAFDNVPSPAIPPLLKGRTIAVAQDAAFCFLYPANVDCLQRLGATLDVLLTTQGRCAAAGAAPSGCRAATRNCGPARWPPTGRCGRR